MGEAITQTIEKFFDNSLENIGRGNSWTYLGPQWAQAATAPSRMYKSTLETMSLELTGTAWSTEGGIRCPSIVAFPKFGPGGHGVIKHDLTTVMDILPTVVGT
jgi:arylsulfatase A-like enzyme